MFCQERRPKLSFKGLPKRGAFRYLPVGWQLLNSNVTRNVARPTDNPVPITVCLPSALDAFVCVRTTIVRVPLRLRSGSLRP